MKYILFPLGNHGEKYRSTRHNAGRFVVSKLQKENLLDEFYSDNRNDIEIFVPECYMNESGKYLKKYLQNKNIENKNIIVIYDDKDIEIGEVKVAINRGDGGHNGIKNIIEFLGDKDFWRIRVGIAPIGTGKDNIIPPHGDIVQKYVLGAFSQDEKDILSSKEYLNKIVNF